jgi:hypothetical protein
MLVDRRWSIFHHEAAATYGKDTSHGCSGR